MEEDGRKCRDFYYFRQKNNLHEFRVQGTRTLSSRATEYLDELARKVTGDLHGEDLIRVIWLSGNASTEFIVACP